MEALIANRPLALSPRTFGVLAVLMSSPDEVLSRRAIYEAVWHKEMRPGDRSVDVVVRFLRRELEKRAPGKRHIHTFYGRGYLYRPEQLDGRPNRRWPVPASWPPYGASEKDRLDAEIVSRWLAEARTKRRHPSVGR
jgi:Transcriptional regulatory protein, C terminal